jgi:hypothetical protein
VQRRFSASHRFARRTKVAPPMPPQRISYSPLTLLFRQPSDPLRCGAAYAVAVFELSIIWQRTELRTHRRQGGRAAAGHVSPMSSCPPQQQQPMQRSAACWSACVRARLDRDRRVAICRRPRAEIPGDEKAILITNYRPD